MAEQARGSTSHTTASGVPHDADDPLVRAVWSGAVREGDDGKPEHASDCNTGRQSYETSCPHSAAILSRGLDQD